MSSTLDDVSVPETLRSPSVVRRCDCVSDTRRGGDLRVLLSPRTAGSTSGFMGHVGLAPGESVAEHYHPYSEEFLFVTEGSIVVRLNGDPHRLDAGEAVLIPPFNRHRLENHSEAPAAAVFHLGPLAPRPELGHVDTEPTP
jgi:putative monooxygenase